MLSQSGDEVPSLILVRADEVLPGDVVWGVQHMANPKEGFTLGTEGVVSENGPEPVASHWVRVGSYMTHPHWMVLVENFPGRGDEPVGPYPRDLTVR